MKSFVELMGELEHLMGYVSDVGGTCKTAAFNISKIESACLFVNPKGNSQVIVCFPNENTTSIFFDKENIKQSVRMVAVLNNLINYKMLNE